MKFGSMLRDIATSLVRRPVTERYPYERREAPERLRGKLRWQAAACTGCGLCAMDCPAGAIEVIVLDKKAKQFVLRYQANRCTFCGQCLESCRQGALVMSAADWELARLGQEAFNIYYGSEPDVATVLVRRFSPDAEPAAGG